MIRLRKSRERGHFDHGWLDTYHTFSFADYQDPAHMGFRTLRVINEDRVKAGEGFGTHGHRDMEIVTYVLDGALEHKDSMGNSSVIRPGEVQRMTAGTGVRHSEFNPLKDKDVHLLQIWILPAKEGLTPGYEQRAFNPAGRRNRLRLVASPDGESGSVKVHQDVRLYDGSLEKGASLSYKPGGGRGTWLQVTKGKVVLNGRALAAGDGVAADDEKEIRLESPEHGEFLLFDLH